ncbi:MAG TPA: base excision DNA repair protein [Acidisarcina sp.]
MKLTRSQTSRSRKPSPQAARKLREMYDALVATYGPQQWWPAKTPFEVIVGAYLTQNTSWRGVALSIARLAEAGLLTIEGIRCISEEDLRAVIRPSGYMVRKAAALKGFVAWLDREYGGSLEQLASESTWVARDKLLALPGVGPETADAILLYALGHPVMVVDEYLRRVTARHRLVREGATYTETQDLRLMAFFEGGPVTRLQHYNEFHALIVAVGKRHCGPQPRCERCPLAGFQPRPRGSHRKTQDGRQ